MRTSRDPLQPIRSWSELLFGTRRLKMKKLTQLRDRIVDAKIDVLPPQTQSATAD